MKVRIAWVLPLVAAAISATASPLAAQVTPPTPPSVFTKSVDEGRCRRGETPHQCYERALLLATEKTAGRETPDYPRAAALMNDACSLGEKLACYYYARLTDEGMAGDSIQARLTADRYAAACVLEVAESCRRLGDAFAYGVGREKDGDRAVFYYERGCALGSGSSCQKASVRYDEITAAGWTVSGLSRAQRDTLAAQYAERGCALGSPNSCVAAGWRRGWRSSHDVTRMSRSERQELRSLFTTACETGNMAGCNNLGALFAGNVLDVAAPDDSARFYYQRACIGSARDLKAGLGCRNVGRLFQEGKLGAVRLDSAIYYFAAGCELRDPQSCDDLADARPDSLYLADDMLVLSITCIESGEECVSAGYLAETAVRDLEAAAQLYMRACALEDAVGCSNLATARFSTVSIAAGRDNTLRYGRLGCDLGNAEACSRMRSRLLNIKWRIAANYYRDRGCEVKHLYLCAERSRMSATAAIAQHSLRGHAVRTLGIPASVVTGLSQAWEDSLYYDTYSFAADSGSSVVIKLHSEDFDAFLVVGTQVGTDSLKVIDYDDDAGGGSDSQLVFVAPQTRTYLIQARSIEGTDTGSYALTIRPDSVKRRVPTPPYRQFRYRLGAVNVLPPADSVTARMTGDTTQDGFRQQTWTFKATAGVPITATLSSRDFRLSSLVGLVVDSAQFETIPVDVWPDSTYRSHFIPEVDGTYSIRVYGANGAKGDYHLRLDRGLAAPTRKPVTSGSEIRDSLTIRDAALDDGSLYDEYVFHGSVGERLELTLSSHEFDTLLMIGRPSAATISPFVEIGRAYARPDDPAQVTRLKITLREAGDYAIRVNTFGPAQRGAYILKVNSVRQ